ncbi:MAG TPA: aminotransferase class V-fold PLP-dependent enzyme [Trebonia sp.]
MTHSMASQEFRALFPALDRWAWFDTPAAPPAAGPVADALTAALEDWRSGRFSWQGWDSAPGRCREAFAGLAGVDPATVSLHGSAAEGVATVAQSLPPGSVVIPGSDYRSVLFPLLALDQDRNPVLRAGGPGGADATEHIAAMIRQDTVLVAVSQTLTSAGCRLDLARLAAAAHAAGARLLVDMTQSFGVLDWDLAALGADHVIVHGYKWLLCPRGAAWMATRADRLDRLDPLMPNWKSTSPPHGYFGGDLAMLASTAARLDASPAWLSWIGAEAALEIMSRLDPAEVEAHCTGLARAWSQAVRELGFTSASGEQQSHIAVAEMPGPAAGLSERLENSGIKASVTGRRLRIGVHYFNTADDVDRMTDVLKGIAHGHHADS